MIDGSVSRMTDAAVHAAVVVLLGRIQMTESGLYGTWRRKEGAELETCTQTQIHFIRSKDLEE